MRIVKHFLATWCAVSLLALGLAAPARSDSGDDEKALVVPNYTAIWWNDKTIAVEDGWGINLSHQGDQIYVTWYTYDSDHNPLWIAGMLFKIADGVYSGKVYTYTGPPFNSDPFPPSQQVATEVGTVTITFAADGQSAKLDYTINNITQSKTIVPYVYGNPNPSCTWADNAHPVDLTTATNVQGLWWARIVGTDPPKHESGYGINFVHQGSTIAATWYTYDVNGQHWWLLMPLSRQGTSKTYTGPIYTFVGPSFDSVPWGPPKVGTIRGNAKIEIIDGNHVTFTYTVDGVQQVKYLDRTVFNQGGTICTYPDNSQAYVAALVALAGQANSGAITNDQFANQLQQQLAAIDAIDGASDQLKAYLATNVVGHAITVAESARLDHAARKDLTTDLFDLINSSPTYQVLQATVAATQFFQNAVNGNFVNAPDPATLVAIATIDTRTRILDAMTSGQITPQKMNDLLAANNNNPYEALRELLLALAIPVPDWLLPAPVACLSNCVDQHKKFSGPGSGTAQLAVQVPVQCTFNISYSGTADVDITIHPNKTVEGSIHVAGTVHIDSIVQPSNPLCQLVAIPAINTTANITGTVDHMTAVLNISGITGNVVGHIEGDTLFAQIQDDSGKISLNFILSNVVTND